MNNDINFQPPEDNPGDGGLNGLNNLNDLNDGAGESGFGLSGTGGIQNGFNNAGMDAGEAVTNEEIDEAAGKHKFKINDFSISGIWNAIKEYWLGLQVKTKVFAVSSAAALVILVVVLTVILNRSPFVKTFIGLENDKEALEITNLLKENNIQSKYDSTFRTISVKEKDMDLAVMIAAQRSYPQTGFLYDEETSSNILETQQEKQDRELRNRQKRLEASLGLMTGIEFATVNLNIPDNSRAAITREILPSTASIMLYTKMGVTLSPETVKGIENMIQKSIANLSVDDITIVDQNGIILNEYQEESETVQYSNWVDIKRDFENNEQKKMYNTLWNLLAPVYGADGVTIACNVDSDFDEFIREAKSYDGANSDENDQKSGMPSAKAIDWTVGSSESDILGQEVPDLNTDDPSYYETAGDAEAPGYNEGYHFTEEYLVDYVLEQMQRRTPDIKNKSVAIFIDADELDPDVEERMILQLGNAVGINDLAKKDLPPDEYILDVDYLRNYVSILAVPFNRPYADEANQNNSNIFGFQPIQLLMALALALIIIIIMAIIIISISNRRKEEREEAFEREEALLDGDGAAVRVMPGMTPFGLAAGRYAAASSNEEYDDGEEEDESITPIETREQALKKQIKQFAEQNPEIAAQLVKTLLKGDEMGNG